MNENRVLNSRRRAAIALIHSVVFLGVALHGFVSPKAGMLVQGSAADLVLIVVYLVVTSVLTWLVSLSRSTRERLYFVLCTSSATFGLLRTIFGDAAIPAAQYLRVIMLASAVTVGMSILRSFWRPVSERAASE